MSKSFMDAIRGVVTEGAREKTADGMTKDAKHFIDLHKVQDSGMKHLVQKDSETKEYEKMFSGDVDRAPSNRASNAPGQDLDKYVEYNEHVEILEAKKKERGCSEDCECKDCKDDKKDMKENYAVPGTPAYAAYQRALKQNQGSGQALPLQAGQKMPQMRDGRDASGGGGVRKPVTPFKPSLPASKPGQTGVEMPKPLIKTGPKAGAPVSPAAREPSNKAAPVSPAAREPAAPAAKPPIPKAKPAAPEAAAPKKAAAPRAAAPKAAAPRAAAPATPAQRAQGRRRAERHDVGPAYSKAMNQSFEFEVNGTSYLVSEAHASAIAAFIEKYGMVNEMDAGEFISKEMKHPEKLTAKGRRQQIRQALAVYYSKKRRGENP